MARTADEVTGAIATFLATKSVPPTHAWLQTFIPTIRLTTPLLALQKTALFRLLATDITTSLLKPPSSCFPPNTTDPQVKETSLRGPITVQVLDVEDIGRSRWSQFESLEAHERGETTKGREVIRVVPEANGPDATQAETKSSGPHKLLLQDANGSKVYAMELTPVRGVGLQMAIGAKLVLRDCVVARGVLLLEDRGVEVLGGKVEVWDRKWREGRKGALKEKAGVREGGG
ncbi:hypothetical protein LTR08_003211 [Meristemomyces frigidus]|nr:hypothetical protein LTR08_003211 [Meristemomyces frigidus]